MKKRTLIVAHEFKIGAEHRRSAMGHQSLVVWMTGLSGSGKSTIADLLEQRLFGAGMHTCVLDGDNTRTGLCSDLGFDFNSRRENNRRVAEVAKILAHSGLVVIVSLISPLKEDRDKAKNIIGSSLFREIYVHASLEACIQRDVKGLYHKAISGEIHEFTGISSPYEPPEAPDMIINTEVEILENCVDELFNFILKSIK